MNICDKTRLQFVSNMSGRRSDSFRSTGSNSSGQPPSKKPSLTAEWEKTQRTGASGFRPGQPTHTTSPKPGKKVSAEWYRDYEKTSFVHDTSHEFEATKIHTQSYDHRIAHIKGLF